MGPTTFAVRSPHLTRRVAAPVLNETEARKRRAAERAVGFIESGMRVGLGTGSTARHVVDVLAEKLRTGALHDIVGVPTSRATEQHARASGVPLSKLDALPRLDLTIDGADEFDPHLDLIKGLGGALLWEKIVASASDRLVIVVDESKRVERLGTRAPLPVELVPFGWRTHLPFLESLGAVPTLRTRDDGAVFTTDGGHCIVDCRFAEGIADAHVLEDALDAHTGIVDSGLFLDMTTHVIVAGDDVEVLERGR